MKKTMYLKITSPKQAFDIWLNLEEFNSNGRIMSDLFKLSGGCKSKHYQQWCETQYEKQT